MDVKKTLLPGPPVESPVKARRQRHYLLPAILGAATLLYWLHLFAGSYIRCRHGMHASASSQLALTKVPLEAHIMHVDS